MIIKFNLFKNNSIFERLGYNEEVSKLTEYVWSLYKKGVKEIDLDEYSKKNMSIYINKLIIREYNNKDDQTMMAALYNHQRYVKEKKFIIEINRSSKPSMMSLEHEIKHMYDFIKAECDLYKLKDKKLLGPFLDVYSTNEDVEKFLYTMYITEMNEIVAWYHADVRNFKNNRHKYKNDIRKFIKYSRLQNNLNYLNGTDINEIINNISIEDKNAIMNIYFEHIEKFEKFFKLMGIEYKYEHYKDKIKKFLKNLYSNPQKQYTEKEIEAFFNRFKKEVERKKKIYLKYIGRLYSIFSN